MSCEWHKRSKAKAFSSFLCVHPLQVLVLNLIYLFFRPSHTMSATNQTHVSTDSYRNRVSLYRVIRTGSYRYRIEYRDYVKWRGKFEC